MALTRGNPVGALGLLDQLDPNLGSYTGISPAKDEGTAVIGQMVYTPGDRSAHVSFLTPGDNLDQPGLPALLENLAVQAGSWGACHLLADVEENSPALRTRSPAAVFVFTDGRRYGSSRPPSRGGHTLDLAARRRPTGENAARSLYQQLVPPLVQTAEPFAPGGQRLLYRQDDELLAYAEINSGSQGIYVQPIIHPGLKDIDCAAGGSAHPACRRRTCARYTWRCVPTRPGWKARLTAWAGSPAPQQALLVKHLAALAARAGPGAAERPRGLQTRRHRPHGQHITDSSKIKRTRSPMLIPAPLSCSNLRARIPMTQRRITDDLHALLGVLPPPSPKR